MVDGATGLRICLLGELKAAHDGAPLDLGGRRQRAVLALLVLARGEVVPTDRLVDAVWGSEAPADAVSALQSYVSHLRRRVQPGVPARARSAVIVREGPGYAVRQPADAVDAWRFEELLRDAEVASGPAEAAVRLREALGLWAGPALADYADEPWAESEIARLTELRLVARERLLAARLDIEEAALLVPELETLVADDPMREERWRLLVLALYRAHRQADALAALRRARACLAEELGVDPGPALQDLEAEVLRQSPALIAPSRDLVEGASPGTVGDAVRGRDALVEREEELAAITLALDDLAQGRHGLLLVEGPAGIGKTRLLNEVRRLARERSVEALSARGSELESAFAFGVVRQVFEPTLVDDQRREELFGGPAARAQTVFDLPEGEAADGFDVLHGLYWLTVNVAARAPVLLTVDDAQWCDAASLRYLAFLARRLDTAPVLLVATVRTSGEEPHHEELLAELALEPDAVVLRPTVLSHDATAELVAGWLGATPAELFTTACHRTTSGNPLLLGQLLRALAADGIRPDAAHADRVVAVGSRAISSSVLLRLRRLPAHVVEVARAGAVLGDGAALPTVAALAGLSEPRTADALAMLVRVAVVSDQEPLAFVHPLVRDAVYRGLPAAERGLRHEHAASILLAAGASVEQVAAHLLLAPPRGSAEVVTLLRSAASEAAGRGVADSAVTYLRRALDESPTGAWRAELIWQLGLLEASLDGPVGVAHLVESYHLQPDPAKRAGIAIAAVSAQVFASPPGVATAFAREAESQLPDGLVDERQALIALQRFGGFMHAIEDAWRTPAPAPTGDGPGARMLAATIALEALLDGSDRGVAVEQARFALEGDRLLSVDEGLFWVNAAAVRMVADDDIGDFWSRARAARRSHGSLFSTLSISLWEGYHRWRRGELREALDRLGEALEQDRMWHGAGLGEPIARAFLIGCHLDRGDLPAAREVAGQSRCQPVGEGGRIYQHALARLLQAEERWAEALVALDAAPEGIVIANPAWNPWRSIKAVALHHLGRPEAAIQVAEEEVRLLRAWGAPSSLGAGLCLLGQLRDEQGLADLLEAVRLLTPTSAAIERARAQCVLGSRSEVTDEEAVPLLLEACHTAERRDARTIGEQARAELVRRGQDPVAPWPAEAQPLTETERRVLDLTADGLSVEEVAQRLFLPPETVRDVVARTDRSGTGQPAQVSLNRAGT